MFSIFTLRLLSLFSYGFDNDYVWSRTLLYQKLLHLAAAVPCTARQCDTFTFHRISSGVRTVNLYERSNFKAWKMEIPYIVPAILFSHNIRSKLVVYDTEMMTQQKLSLTHFAIQLELQQFTGLRAHSSLIPVTDIQPKEHQIG